MMGDIIVERTRPVRKPESPSGAHVFTATTGKESHVEVSCVKHHKKKIHYSTLLMMILVNQDVNLMSRLLFRIGKLSEPVKSLQCIIGFRVFHAHCTRKQFQIATARQRKGNFCHFNYVSFYSHFLIIRNIYHFKQICLPLCIIHENVCIIHDVFMNVTVWVIHIVILIFWTSIWTSTSFASVYLICELHTFTAYLCCGELKDDISCFLENCQQIFLSQCRTWH